MVNSIVLTADGAVKASPGKVYAIMACGDGVTSGDSAKLVDSLTSTGTSYATIVFDSTDEVVTFTPCKGINFYTGIYLDVTKTSGTMTVTVVYE